MAEWNTGTRLEEIELLLIFNKTKIFQAQDDYIKVMELIQERTNLEIEKHDILK